jgi:outer membrane protein assembly factor BamA
VGGLVLMLVCMPGTGAAQEPPKFLLETIRVEGVQRAAARQIVREESLLVPGTTYTEQELRLAVYRVKRLPFVVDAELSLRKGSERGAYELVITVEEAKPVFFLAQADGTSSAGWRPRAVDWVESATAGGRYFVGSHGLAYGSVQGFHGVDGTLLRAGYTQYDLFGKGSFAGLDVSTLQGIGGLDNRTISLAAGYPLTAAQSLRASVFNEWWREDRFFKNETDRWDASLSWIYDTTDDPLFPSSGTKVSAGSNYSQDRTVERSRLPGEEDFRSTSHDFNFAVFGQRYWPVTARQSVSVELDGIRSKSGTSDGFDGTDLRAILAVGYAWDLLGLSRGGRSGDLRFETTLLGNYEDFSPAFGQSPAKSVGIQASLAYRNAWGVARLSFRYADLWSSL